MRGIRSSVLLLAGWLAASAAGRAGVYNTTEPPFLPPIDKLDFVLSEWRGVPGAANVPARPGGARWVYLQQLADLEARARDGVLTTTDRVNLGACYIRLQRDNDAIRVLQAGDPKHFLILANLATAYHGLNELDRAIACQQQALAVWPAVWAGWNRTALDWYRRAERYYLTLLRLRHREQLEARGALVKVTGVDALFPKFRLEGPNGYEPGVLPRETLDELPPDALQIVVQLVLWQPFDDRLYWLLGELLNGHGQIDPAVKVLEDLLTKRNRSDIQDLVRHRKVLLQAKATLETLRSPSGRAALYAVLTPRGTLLPPIVGDVSQESAALAPFFLKDQAPPEAPSQTAAAPRWTPDWRQLLVGFGSGVVVAVIGAFQWQEWRRRRAGARATARGAATEERLAGDPLR